MSIFDCVLEYSFFIVYQYELQLEKLPTMKNQSNS
jgi:hypothetical protein